MADKKKEKLKIQERISNVLTTLWHAVITPIDVLMLGGAPVRLSWQALPACVAPLPRTYLRQYGIHCTAVWVRYKIEGGRKTRHCWMYVRHKQAKIADYRLRQFQSGQYVVTSRQIYKGKISERDYSHQQSWGAPVSERTISGMVQGAIGDSLGYGVISGHRKHEQPRRRRRVF